MGDIYQRIWSADQSHNGIEPIPSTQDGDPARGFVKVNAELAASTDPDLRLLPEVVIPPHKSATYDLCRGLFNNYALPEAARETETPEERAERHEFLESIADTPPMREARLYIEQRTQTSISAERWHTTLMDHWFREFEQGGDPQLCGFEHVVVGEQEGPKVQGYHFWYKYYLDDGFARLVDDGARVVPGLADDRIVYVRSHAASGQMAFPDSVTIGYRWNAPDYDALAVRPLTKPIGGFFVGCSVEGLMALGTVRAHLGANAPKTAVIEGASYDMKLFRSPNNRHIRTFYPVFRGAADPVTGEDRPAPLPHAPAAGTSGDIRILAALVNPAGADPGHETVTLVNLGPAAADLAGWRIVDANGKAEVLGTIRLVPGRPETVTLTGAGAQLSNKGGTITLQHPDGTPVHQVSYSKAQARADNRTLLFV